MTGEKSEGNLDLNTTIIDKIDHFLKPKRRAKVFSILAKGTELSQKDLAEAMESTATALSNILVVFANFEYKLLDFSSVGKYRFYKLSQLGEAYLKAKAGSSSADSDGCNSEKQESIHEARAAVDELMQISPDSWEVIMSRLLETRIYGREAGNVKQKLSLEDEDFEKAEQALDQYLACVELAELQSNSVALNQMLDLLPNMVLRSLISDLVEVFSRFSAVINVLDDEKKSVEAYLMVKNAFSTPNDEEIEKYSKLLGWNRETFESLQETANILTKNVSHMGEEEICRYFFSILPGQKGLCMYMARCVCGNR